MHLPAELDAERGGERGSHRGQIITFRRSQIEQTSALDSHDVGGVVHAVDDHVAVAPIDVAAGNDLLGALLPQARRPLLSAGGGRRKNVSEE